jgi:hypothetical protein
MTTKCSSCLWANGVVRRVSMKSEDGGPAPRAPLARSVSAMAR